MNSAAVIRKNIVITGASSGIGAALAVACAAPGATLGLLGRNEARLSETASACAAKGAKVETGLIDVRERETMQRWLETFDAAHPTDLVIANAGISAGVGGMIEPEEQVRGIFAVNLDGVLNTVLPVIPLMRKRRSGQIAIISSLAGIRGLSSCPAYSASKSAVRAYGEGLRGSLKADGIRVNVVCPGFIRTPMTDVNPYPMPLIMSAEKAAGIILKGLERDAPRTAFPWPLYFALLLSCCLPLRLADRLLDLLPKKPALEKP